MIRDIFAMRRGLRRKPMELRRHQYKHLKEIIKFSYENVPFYHKQFSELQIKPNNIIDISDIKKLHFLRKSDIQSYNTSDFVARNIRLDNCRKTTTSGSTGMPLTVYADKRSGFIDDAIWFRAHLERGMKFLDKIASLRDPRYFPEIKFWMDRVFNIRRKYISIFDDPESQLLSLEEFNPNVIRSYPSSLEMLANHSQVINVDSQIIFTSGELITDAFRRLIHSKFSGEVFDNYSNNEVALIAWECKEHNGCARALVEIQDWRYWNSRKWKMFMRSYSSPLKGCRRAV